MMKLYLAQTRLKDSSSHRAPWELLGWFSLPSRDNMAPLLLQGAGRNGGHDQDEQMGL